jgi:hypothetical protein
MGTRRRIRPDGAHHHPRVRRNGPGWAWVCECGGASCRTDAGASWRQAVLGALHHSECLAP